MNTQEAKIVLETALICAQEPLKVGDMRRLFADAVSADTIKSLLEDLRGEWTGRGVGRALIQGVLDLADNWLGLRRLKLKVAADNLAAVALYQGAGFVETGRHRAEDFCDGGFVDSLSMVRFPPDRPAPADAEPAGG